MHNVRILQRPLLVGFMFHVVALVASAEPPVAVPPAAAPPAKTAPAKGAPPLTVEGLQAKLVGYWKIQPTEADIRRNIETETRDSKRLFIDGKLVENPTDAQRDEYRKASEPRIAAELKAMQAESFGLIVQFDANGSLTGVMKTVPVPNFPHVKRGRWKVTEEKGKLFLIAVNEKPEEKMSVISAGDTELVMEATPMHDAPIRIVRLVRLAEPPQWAVDFIKQDSAAAPAKPGEKLPDSKLPESK